MSILYVFAGLIACAIAVVAGAFAMRASMERKREIAEQEDPRDTQLRDLQTRFKITNHQVAQHKVTATEAAEHVDLAHARIEELKDRIDTVRIENDDLLALKESNKEELDLLHNKLSVASHQLDTLKQRVTELEIEVSVTHEPDLLDRKIAGHDDEADTDDELDNIAVPDIADDTPSLLQSLTDELDRWKRHCQVLGDELKNQRDRPSQSAETVGDAQPGIVEIDELTDIRGIGNALARKLHQLGIYSYKALTELSDDDLVRGKQLIPDFRRRMIRDAWVDQASKLHDRKYGGGSSCNAANGSLTETATA